MADFGSVASNNYNTIQGIYYCNHACAMRPANNDFVWNGALICRDEAIIFSRTCRFVYDSRVHSRYNDSPDKFVDLGLPPMRVKLTRITEIQAVNGYYGSPGTKAISVN